MADPLITLVVLDGPPPLARGEMRFYDEARPPITPGTWTLTASQSVKDPVLKEKIRVDAGPGLQIRIHGPRYALDPTEILGCYPAPGPDADTDRLPHIVLRRRTLPWERKVGGASGAHGLYFGGDNAPWMALLLLRPDEIVGGDVQHNKSVPPEYLPVDPSLGASTGEPVLVNWLQVRWGVLRKLLPISTELPLLSHVREMCRLDRELRDDDDGFAAIVMGNRQPVAIDGKATKYVAALVSLETKGAFWKDSSSGNPAKDAPTADDVIHTLVALHHWKFETGDGATFAQFTHNLIDQGIERLGERDADPNLPAGALTLATEEEDGSGGIAVYRGPLTPVPLTRSDAPPAWRADTLVRVDPVTGTPDIGEVSAFELGRLLALGSPAVLGDLLRFREAQHITVLRIPPMKVPINRLADLLTKFGKPGCFIPGETTLPVNIIDFVSDPDDPWSAGGGTPGPDDGIDGGGWLKTLIGKGGGILNGFPSLKGGSAGPTVPGSPGGSPGVSMVAYAPTTLDSNFSALMGDISVSNLPRLR